MNKTIIIFIAILFICNTSFSESTTNNITMKVQFKSPQSDQRTTLLIQYRNRMESLKHAKTDEERNKILSEIEIIKKQLNNVK